MASVSIVRWIVYLAIILLPIHGNITYQNGNVRVAADCSAWYSEKNATAYDVRADWDTTVHLGSFDVCRVEVHGPCTGAKAKGTGKAEARSKNTIAIQGNPRRLERARWRSERSEIEADERKNKPNECDTYSGYVEVKLVEWQDEACRMELRVLDETKTRNEGKVVLEKKSNCAWDTWTQQEQLNIETEQEQQQQEHNQNQEPEREHEPNQEAETEAQDQKVQLQKSDKSEGNREMKGVRVKLDEGHYLVVELKVGNVVSWQRQADRSRFAMELGVTFEVDESETKAGDKCVKCVEGAEEDEEVKNELRFEGRHEQEGTLLDAKLVNVSANRVRQSSREERNYGQADTIRTGARQRRYAISELNSNTEEYKRDGAEGQKTKTGNDVVLVSSWLRSTRKTSGGRVKRSEQSGKSSADLLFSAEYNLWKEWLGWFEKYVMTYKLQSTVKPPAYSDVTPAHPWLLGYSWKPSWTRTSWNPSDRSWTSWTPSQPKVYKTETELNESSRGETYKVLTGVFVTIGAMVVFVTVCELCRQKRTPFAEHEQGEQRHRIMCRSRNQQSSSNPTSRVQTNFRMSDRRSRPIATVSTGAHSCVGNEWRTRTIGILNTVADGAVQSNSRHAPGFRSTASHYYELTVGRNDIDSRRSQRSPTSERRANLGFERHFEANRASRSGSNSATERVCAAPILGIVLHYNPYSRSSDTSLDEPPSFEEALRLSSATHIGESNDRSTFSDLLPPSYEQATTEQEPACCQSSNEPETQSSV